MVELNESQLCRRAADKLGGKWLTFTEVKSGSVWVGAKNRFDLVAIYKSWTKPCIRIYEAKSDRRTFLNDQKWPGYLDYCNEFYWLCPTGLIEKNEVDPRCGLITINPKSGGVHTRKKAIFRDIEPICKSDLLMYLFMWRMGTKAIGMTREEQIVLIQKDMEEDKDIGAQYACHISKTLDEAASRYRERERALIRRESNLKFFEKWCEEAGLNQYEVQNALKKDKIIKLIQSTNPNNLKPALRSLVRDIKRITPGVEAFLEMLEEKNNG